MNWKKIKPGAFRTLDKNEVRILFIRHGEHNENITLPKEAQLLIEQGQRLAKAGIVVSGAISSSADRAISAIYFTKQGMGIGGYTDTDPNLDDLESEEPELVAQLKAEAKAAGVEPEVHIFTVCARDPSLRKMMAQRGDRGAIALYRFARGYSGKTILSASHGGSRMEVVIASLSIGGYPRPPYGSEWPNIPRPDVLLDRGQIAEIILTLDHESVVEVNYLEPLNRTINLPGHD